MNYKKIASIAASSAMMLYMVFPTAAATELIISGNGSDSTSAVEFGQQTTTMVVQTNVTDVDNNIDIKANTGSNEAKDNTGGNVSIETGDVNAKVEVANVVNSNVAEVENCGECGGDTSVLIEGNGTGTDNYVGLGNSSATNVFQTNVAKIDNDVDLKLNTGKNDAKDNTGGDVYIDTGDIDSVVKLHNQANSNTAYVAGSGDGGNVDLIISGNGSDSDNGIQLGLARTVMLTQTNVTDIDNDVDVKAKTGYNDAKGNTGGEVYVDTGDIDVKVMVDNMAGFNQAYVDDCCYDDVFAKIAGNGTDSENYIGAGLDQSLAVFQENLCGGGCHHGGKHRSPACFDNDIDADALTGKNDAKDNTGEGDSDPSIMTGDVDTHVEVENMGGSNTYGQYAPDMGGDSNGWNWGGFSFDFQFSFSLSDLLEALIG